jgi:glutathionyl-hydroquinone reductase
MLINQSKLKKNKLMKLPREFKEKIHRNRNIHTHIHGLSKDGMAIWQKFLEARKPKFFHKLDIIQQYMYRQTIIAMI